MKILITSIVYPGMIGVSTYIEQLIQGLKNHGHHVDLFAHNPFVINLNKRNRNLKSQHHVANYQAAASRLPFDRYDIIHSQGIIPTVAISRIKPKNIPLVTSLHGALAFNMLINGAITKHTPSWYQSIDIESMAVSSSDICIVGSHWLKNVVLNDYKVHESQQFAIIPYGINLEEFAKKMELPSPANVPQNKFILACTARLVPLKGHQFLLASLAKLKRQRQDWVCWIIGEGPLRNQLRQQADRHGLGKHVIFLGNQKNVASLLKEADLFVFPSLQDNMPYAVMEAQLAGVPVVATDAGGIPEMIKNGQTGLISPKLDSDSLYQNINTLMENTELREILAKNGKQWAINNWALEKMIKNTISVYQQALDMKKE